MTHPAENDALTLRDEGALFSYLDEYLNANGADPQVVGYDAALTPFVAWLDEEGGDCVGLRVSRLTVNDGGVTSSLTEVEAPAQGHTSDLVYPVRILQPTTPIPPASSDA